MKCWWVGIQSVFGKHSFCNNLKNFDFISFITFYSIILPRIVCFFFVFFFDCMSIFRTVRAPRSALSYFRVLLFPFFCSSSIFCLWPWNQAPSAMLKVGTKPENHPIGGSSSRSYIAEVYPLFLPEGIKETLHTAAIYKPWHPLNYFLCCSSYLMWSYFVPFTVQWYKKCS